MTSTSKIGRFLQSIINLPRRRDTDEGSSTGSKKSHTGNARLNPESSKTSVAASSKAHSSRPNTGSSRPDVDVKRRTGNSRRTSRHARRSLPEQSMFKVSSPARRSLSVEDPLEVVCEDYENSHGKKDEKGRSHVVTEEVSYGGGEFIEDDYCGDYIEDDYCQDYSSSDTEALSRFSMNSHVKMGVSSLKRRTPDAPFDIDPLDIVGLDLSLNSSQMFTRSLEDITLPEVEHIMYDLEADTKHFLADNDPDFRSLSYHGDRDHGDTNYAFSDSFLYYESVSGQNFSQTLDFMSVSDLNPRHQPHGQIHPNFLAMKTPEKTSFEKVADRPQKNNKKSIAVEETTGIYFFENEEAKVRPTKSVRDEDRVRCTNRRDTSKKTSSSKLPLTRLVQHNPLFKDGLIGHAANLISDTKPKLSAFSNLVQTSPGFPESPQHHIYRPTNFNTDRRDSGYMSKCGTPTSESPAPSLDSLDFGEKLKKLTKQKTFVVSYPKPLNLTNVGVTSPATLDVIDGIKTASEVAAKSSNRNMKSLRPLVEIHEVSPRRRSGDVTSYRAEQICRTSVRHATQPNDLNKPLKSRRSISLEPIVVEIDDTIMVDVTNVDNSLVTPRTPGLEAFDFPGANTFGHNTSLHNTSVHHTSVHHASVHNTSVQNKSLHRTPGSKVKRDCSKFTTPVTKLKRETPTSSTPLLRKSASHSALSRLECTPLTEDLSPVRCFDKVRFSKAQKGRKRAVKRELNIVTTENSSTDSRFSRKVKKKRSKRDKENSEPEKADASKENFQQPKVSDYILLKKMAEDIVASVPGYRSLWDQFNLEKLINFLNEFFHQEINRLHVTTVKSICTLRHHLARHAHNEAVGMEPRKCLTTLMSALLLKDQIRISDCRRFIFRNLPDVARECPELLTAAPEIVAMLLGNEDTTMVNSQGFPLAYNEAEVEVMKVVKRCMDARKAAGMEVGGRTTRVLLSVTDRSALDSRSSPASPMLRRNLGLQYSSLKVSDTNDSPRAPHKKLTHRPYHEIRYEPSEACIVTGHNRKEDPQKPNYAESSKENPSRPRASVQACSAICSNHHHLRKVSVAYIVKGDTPMITSIDMQYSSEEKKRRKRLTLGEPHKDSSTKTKHAPIESAPETSDSGMYSRGTSERSSVSLVGRAVSKDAVSSYLKGLGVSKVMRPTSKPSDLKAEAGSTTESVRRARPFVLRKGEHIVGLNVQGDEFVQNIELTTNLGRHRCLLPTGTGAPWYTVEPPLAGPPYCLQAIYADVHKSRYSSNFRSVGAVWAVMSKPLNNLNV